MATALAASLRSGDDFLGLESPGWHTKPLHEDEDGPTKMAADRHGEVKKASQCLEQDGSATMQDEAGAGAKKTVEKKVYTLEEVGLHKGPESYWTVVGDSVYDVSSFVLSGRHPGGDLIHQGTASPSNYYLT
jgi:cytochrome b involved in lipid metabolism